MRKLNDFTEKYLYEILFIGVFLIILFDLSYCTPLK